MKGVVLLPTLNRPKLLENFIKSYVETEATVEVRMLIDQEDFVKNEAAYKALVLPPTFSIELTGSNVSMGDKCRHVWPQIQSYDWVGLINDDHYFLTKGWDQMTSKLLNGMNFISTNDKNWNFGKTTVGLTAWSMKLLKELDIPIFPRKLQHLYIDNFWASVGQSTGAWLETNRINVDHRHAFKGEMEQDETFKKVYSQESNQYDQKEFEHIMEQDFKNICLKVTEIRINHEMVKLQ